MKMLRALLAAALLTLPLAALTRVPYAVPGGSDAVLRLSWRMTDTADETCRPRTEQELERLPVHMRTAEVCTREDSRYLLVTRVGALPPDTTWLSRGGVKGDRPLFVGAERRLEPGTYQVVVGLYRERAGAVAEPVAALDTQLVMRTGEVNLITLDSDGRTLRVRSPR